jgi:hypothetical protein
MTQPLDGNVLAGPLATVFTTDVTSATATCAGCGRADVLATSSVYGAPMGLILRCTGCGDALLRLAQTPDALTVDMRGIAALRITITAPG